MSKRFVRNVWKFVDYKTLRRIGGKELFCLKVGFLSMNSLFFDKWGDKFSTDSSVFSTNVSRVLQGWKEEDNFAAEKGIRDLKGSGI